MVLRCFIGVLRWFYSVSGGAAGPNRPPLLLREALQSRSLHVAFCKARDPAALRAAVTGLVRNARGPSALRSLGEEGQEIAWLGGNRSFYRFE